MQQGETKCLHVRSRELLTEVILAVLVRPALPGSLPTSHGIGVHEERSTLAFSEHLRCWRPTYVLFIDVTNKHIFWLFIEREKEKKVKNITVYLYSICICKQV